jgi:aspartate aminotransferase-like enzyme
MHNGSKFLQAGLQTAAGVPLQCGERDDFKTFRIGLFGLEKLHDPDQTVTNLSKALDKVLAE